MNYLQNELKNALSSEYVLGTLSGKARLRYKRLLMEEDGLQKNVWHWERQLNQLATTIPEQKPDDVVWDKIQLKLGFSIQESIDSEPWWKKLLTPHLAIINLLLIMVVLFLWQNLQMPYTSSETQRFAIVQNSQAEALWSIEIKPDFLKVQATAKLKKYANNDYQLWMIEKGNPVPISLGLLPQTGTINIAKLASFNNVDIQALAVSLEPLGGSPNGQPTTVLYTTELVVIDPVT